MRGSGIAALVPYVLDHVSRASASNHPTRTKTRAVTLVWTNKCDAFIHSVAEEELGTALQRADITGVFYCSGYSTAGQSTSSSPSSPDTVQIGEERTSDASVFGGKEETEVSESPDTVHGVRVIIRAGRPEISSMIDMTAASAVRAGSRLAVMACGPAGMADAAREATYRAMRQWDGKVEYFEEAFGW